MTAASGRAREKAEALRQRLDLGHGRIDIFEVLRSLEIEVYRKSIPNDGLEGALEVRDGVRVIFVNSQGALTLQRMTAAHELGHLQLEGDAEGTQILEQRAMRDEPAEWEAFRFGRYFLMDGVGVENLVRNIKDEEQRVAAVASHFLVSPAVAALHLREMNLIKSATRTRLKAAFDAGEFRPGTFLARFGYRMPDLFDSVTELDPAHVQRSFAAYERGDLSLTALAEVLQCSEEEAIEQMIGAGVAVRTEAEEPDEDE
jgi:Zn-dependent peptidase ImmA (M78 family)